MTELLVKIVITRDSGWHVWRIELPFAASRFAKLQSRQSSTRAGALWYAMLTAYEELRERTMQSVEMGFDKELIIRFVVEDV